MSSKDMFTMRRTIKGAAIPLPYGKIARAILGPTYELSLVICGDKLARKMNIKYRKKSYFPNVLSFPYGKHEGEIFLNIRKSAREALQYGVPEKERLALLFVHGCLHLKGHLHGLTMERLERKTLRDFGIMY